jgi:hypothetical protein
MLKNDEKIILHLNSTTSPPGPHRMGCGARGICNSPQQLESAQPEKSIPIKNVDNNTS